MPKWAPSQFVTDKTGHKNLVGLDSKGRTGGFAETVWENPSLLRKRLAEAQSGSGGPLKVRHDEIEERRQARKKIRKDIKERQRLMELEAQKVEDEIAGIDRAAEAAETAGGEVIESTQDLKMLKQMRLDQAAEFRQFKEDKREMLRRTRLPASFLSAQNAVDEEEAEDLGEGDKSGWQGGGVGAGLQKSMRKEMWGAKIEAAKEAALKDSNAGVETHTLASGKEVRDMSVKVAINPRTGKPFNAPESEMERIIRVPKTIIPMGSQVPQHCHN